MPDYRRRFLIASLAALCGAAGLPARAQAPAEPAQGGILVVGDSLSAEYGLRRGSGWVAMLAEKLQDRKPREPVRVDNASISGDTTSGGASRLPAALARYRPAIVIIELGSNDALRGLSLDMTRDNLSAMVAMAQEAGARVLLVGMQIPPNYGRVYTERFRRLFAEVAARFDTGLVPFLMDGIADKRELFQDDGIHPNEQAQAMLADNVWTQLEPMLE